MRFGEKLKSLRQARDWTQPELADRIGIEQSYLSKLENDKSVPSADIFRSILSCFEMDISVFMQGIDEQWLNKEFKSLPQVAEYLDETSSQRTRQKSRKLTLAAASCVMGIVFLAAGYSAWVFPNFAYQYQSEGIVLEGESKEVFRNWRQMQGADKPPQFQVPFSEEYGKWKARTVAKEQEMYQRKNEDYIVTDTFKGTIFNVPVAGGSRTYRLTDDIEIRRLENNIMMMLGTFLIASGCFGLLLSLRKNA